MNDDVVVVVGIMVVSAIIGMVIYTILDKINGVSAKLDEVIKLIKGMQMNKHGDLIDRKTLLDELYSRDYTKFTHRDFVALVHYADTVVEGGEHAED